MTFKERRLTRPADDTVKARARRDPKFRRALANEAVKLSHRDSARVLALLENPPKPNAKLRAAMKRHRKIFGR